MAHPEFFQNSFNPFKRKVILRNNARIEGDDVVFFTYPDRLLPGVRQGKNNPNMAVVIGLDETTQRVETNIQDAEGRLGLVNSLAARALWRAGAKEVTFGDNILIVNLGQEYETDARKVDQVAGHIGRFVGGFSFVKPDFEEL